MRTILLTLFLFSIAFSGISQEKKFLRKAVMAMDRMKYEEALSYYDLVLQENKDSYHANAGKGMLLAEFMERYDEAIPYLEKALRLSPKDTVVKIFYTVGKSYHYIGEYEEALKYYKKVEPYNEIGDEDFQTSLKKRIADCKYAIVNNYKAPAKNQYIVNLGNPINSEMPEYSSIYTKEKELIFTSKRQDNPKEKKNEWDGKYFEGMYISRMEDGKYTTPSRYTLPDKSGDSKFPKYNEAVISATPDGKTMFLYREGKIYQVAINEKKEDAEKLEKTINFSSYQNHACMSFDGKNLYFTSESKNGYGGVDLFSSQKQSDGNWSDPVLLDTTINTYFDEASPYMSEDGTLYFSSNGLPGYGGFDVYKTRMVNGQWVHPENLGQPINSPANDLFFTLDISSTAGHYSSNRLGGYGDMDVYRVNYSENEKPDCEKTDDPLLAINFIQDPVKQMTYTVELILPAEYSGKFTSATWKINDSMIQHTSMRFPFTFSKPGSYNFEAKIVTACDSCVEIITACKSSRLVIDDNMIAGSSGNAQEPDGEQKGVLNGNQKEDQKGDQKGNNNGTQSDPNNLVNIILEPVFFDYNQSTIRNDAAVILQKNIGILKDNQSLTVTISGNSDSRGDSDYNKKLSLKRALAVKNYLLLNGIDKSRIVGVFSLGETAPVNNCTDNKECSEDQHQQNRRTEFKVKLSDDSKDAASTSVPAGEEFLQP
ncbi:MAG: OmpA family protein [Bacteroidota bacterium]|nr:OmpA family protein [Bacteroidota bacterium]